MNTASILQAVIHRIGKETVAAWGEPFVLEAMNRVYQQINLEHTPIEVELTLPAGTFSSAVQYYPLPSDWIRPFMIEPYREFRPKELFKESSSVSGYETGVFTIKNDRIYFTNVDATTTFVINYYGSGGTFVNETVLSVGQINAPEWPAAFHQIMVYATAGELSADYPLRQQDQINLIRLLSRLDTLRHFRQQVTPNVVQSGRLYNNPTADSPSDLDDFGKRDPY